MKKTPFCCERNSIKDSLLDHQKNFQCPALQAALGRSWCWGAIPACIHSGGLGTKKIWKMNKFIGIILVISHHKERKKPWRWKYILNPLLPALGNKIWAVPFGPVGLDLDPGPTCSTQTNDASSSWYAWWRDGCCRMQYSLSYNRNVRTGVDIERCKVYL